MALKPCKECGEKISKKAKVCPICGSPQKAKKKYGCGTLIVIGIVAIVIMSIVNAANTEAAEKEKQAAQAAARQAQAQKNAVTRAADAKVFTDQIDSHYTKLQLAVDSGDNKAAATIVAQFKRNKKMDYKDLSSISTAVYTQSYLAQIEKHVETKNNKALLNAYKGLAKLHPSNEEYAGHVKRLSDLVAEDIAAANAAQRQAEVDKIKIDALNDIGRWHIGHYVDKFGDATGNGYLTKKKNIRGSFSNTATQDSSLNVNLLISGPEQMSIKLYEYAGNNPVKGSSLGTSYYFSIKDSEGVKHELNGKNYGDRINFGKKESRELHNILSKGGPVMFVAYESGRATTNYKFQVDAFNYKRAMEILEKGKAIKTQEAWNKLLAQHKKSTAAKEGTFVGTWLQSSDLGGGYISLITNKKKHYIVSTFPDGTSGTYEVTYKKIKRIKHYTYTDRPKERLEMHGTQMHCFDEEGLIFIYWPVAE